MAAAATRDAALRSAVHRGLADALREGATAAPAALVADLEAALYAYPDYSQRYLLLKSRLGEPHGVLPGDTLASSLRSRKLTPADAAKDEALRPDPRAIIKRTFAAALLGDARFAAQSDFVVDFVTQLEIACFNATLAASKLTDVPYPRQWSSQKFVERYNTRCATVLSHVDPRGSVCSEFGTALLDRILAGEVAARDLGRMTPAQMCPQATAELRAEIARRSDIKITKKTSDIIVCIKCKQRKCTYEEQQRASLDEQAVLKCECTLCGAKFEIR